MINEIYYNCDLITGEVITPFNGGIFDQIRRSNITVYTGQFGMKELRRAIAQLDGKDPYRDYVDYKMFPHLDGIRRTMSARIFMIDMSDDKPFSDPISLGSRDYPMHPLDEMLYAHGREFDRKVLKRVNAFIEAEQELMYSY